MRDHLNILGFTNVRRRPASETGTELVHIHRPLHRILSHVGYSIHDVVDNPVAKHAVLGYYKLYRQVERGCEIVDLERQWNPL